MSETIAEFVVIVVAFVLAGLVKGVIGLGLPTVAVGVLSLGMTPGRAAAILLIPSLVTNLWQACAGHRLWPALQRLWPLLLATCFGTWAGTVLLAGSRVNGELALGLALLFYAALGLGSVPIRVRPQDERWLGPASGFATGFVTVVTNVYVLPNVLYLSALEWERDELIQGLAASFTVSTLALAASLFVRGEIGPSAVGLSVLAIGPALAGMYAGQILRGRITARTFRLCFFIGLFALGAHLCWRGLR